MVQNVKFTCEKLFLVRSKTFWMVPKYFGQVQNTVGKSKTIWTGPKYLDLKKDKVIVFKLFILTPQIDPISSMVSKLSITVQFVPVEFLPFSRLVVSFNNTLSAFSSRYLIINRCDLYDLSFLSFLSGQQNLVLFENFYPPTRFSPT